jgi:hypothetical protein
MSLRAVAAPVLVAVYSVLVIAAGGGDLVQLRDVAAPIGLAVGAAMATWFLVGLIVREPHRRGVMALAGVVAFASYGYVVDAATRAWRLGESAAGLLALWVLLLWLIAASAIVRRARRSFEPATGYLNAVAGILVLWSATAFAWQVFRHRPVVRHDDLAPLPAQTGAANGSRPHFFLIILDKYTGTRSLRANYGFDNTEFEQALKQRGFIVPPTPRANYVQTFLALAAMLNWQYLDDVVARLGPNSNDWTSTYSLVEDNRTWRALKGAGYRFVFLPTASGPTVRNRFADVQLPDSGHVTHEFEAVWLRTTLLLPLIEAACRALDCDDGRLPYAPESATFLDWKFAQLPLLAESDQPVFVFAHFLLPHEPYVYDEACVHRRPLWPRVDDGAEEMKVKEAYVAQIRCLNRKLEELVDQIQRRAKRPTIIMLQADHGHARLGRELPPLGQAAPTKVAERTDIFAAYRLPRAPAGLINDSIGPVNAMRAIMRYYYGLDLPPLEEATYWSATKLPYALTRIH